MSQLDIAKKVLSHLGLKPSQLPEYLMDDKSKRHKLEDDDVRIQSHYEEDTLWTLKTVRFLKDFQRYRAGVHLETSNKTFLRTAELFRQMGIKNYYFLLQINNPLIKDLDPWDENLTDVQRSMILNECNENIWYVIREVIKVNGSSRFRANRAVISFIWSCLNHLNTTILMPRQSGKFLTNDSKIKLAGGGWTTHGEVKLGDKVLAKDGTETTVVGVYPQEGPQDIYRCTFVDGRVVDAGGPHLWTVWDPGKGRRGKWRTLTTIEVMERQAELAPKGHNSLSVPLPDPDRTLRDIDLPINPYLVGVLIGDGCISGDTVGYCKPDTELAKRVIGTLPPGHILTSHSDGKSHGIIKGPNFDGTMGHKPIRELLEEIGLMGSKWDTKYIPDLYLESSHDQRRLLLQGLMDTDGTAEKRGNTYYSTSNETLAKQVQYLAHSLGHISSITIRDEPKYSYLGETRIGSKAYRVNIRAREPWDLFQDPKRSSRVEQCTRGLKFNSKLAFSSIEKLQTKQECTCIEVDHPDHLYITDNFVVTHNTVGMQVLVTVMQYLMGRGFRSGLITLAASNRMQFVEAVKKMRSAMPAYLTNMTYKDKDAGNILSYEAYGPDKKNTFEVRVPSGGADGAENVSRGSTFEVLLYDEPAWTKYIEGIINGSGPATLTAQKEAREKGIPYFTAKATTPNSILKDEGKYMHDDFMSSTEWREAFFDSYSESHLVQRCIKAAPVSTTSPKIGMMFTHLQLGFGHSWVKETMDKLGLSWSKAKIDLLMMWTEEGMNKLFDDFTREKLADSKKEFDHSEEINETGLFVDWFVSKEFAESLIDHPDEYILMGMDTSDANNRDAVTLVLRRMKTGENLATGRYPLAFMDDVTEVLKELLLRIPNSLLIIERNRAAHMIERLLIMLPSYGIDPFKRIFNDIYDKPVRYEREFKEVMEMNFKYRTKEFYLRYKGKFGFHTGPESRRQMYGFIHEAISLTGAGIRYKLLIDELIGLEIDKDGRIDHKSGGHDDLVIAWLLTFWFIKLGYNKHLYDIPQGMTLTEITTLKDTGDAPKYNKSQLEMFTKIRGRINDLTKELMGCDNNTLASRIEMEIRKLSELIPKEMRKSITIDEILENAKQERNKRAIEKRTKSTRYTMGMARPRGFF